MGMVPPCRDTASTQFLQTEPHHAVSDHATDGALEIAVDGQTASLERCADALHVITVRDARGGATQIPMPAHFKPSGLAARDIDRDGDVDLIVLGDSQAADATRRGALVYRNLVQKSSEDVQAIEAGWQRLLTGLDAGRVQPASSERAGPPWITAVDQQWAAVLQHRSPAAIRDALYGSFETMGLQRIDEDHNVRQVMREFFDRMGRVLSPEQTADRFTALFQRLVASDTAHGDSLFLFALGALPPAHGAALLPSLAREALARINHDYEQRRSWSSEAGRAIANALFALHGTDAVAAARIAEALRVEATHWKTDFPYPGLRGFLAWQDTLDADVGPERGAQYLNYLLQSPHRPYRDEARTILRTLHTDHPDVFWRVAMHGLNQDALSSTPPALAEFDTRLQNAVRHKTVAAFRKTHFDVLQEFVDRHPLSGEDLAHILAVTDYKGRLMHHVAFRFAERSDVQGFQTMLRALQTIDAILLPQKFHQMIAPVFLMESSPYQIRNGSFTLTTMNPVATYRLISGLPVDLLGLLLSPDRRDRGPDFQTKSAFLLQLAGDRPEIFPTIYGRLQGPYIGDGVSVRDAVARLIAFDETSDYSADTYRMIFNSTYLPFDYLTAILEGLPGAMRDRIVESSTNYGLLQHFGRSPLAHAPERAYAYFYENGYHLDPQVERQFFQDLLTQGTNAFGRVINTFARRDTGGRYLSPASEDRRLRVSMSDGTGLGWIYRQLKALGALDGATQAWRVTALHLASDNYFAHVDLLRTHFGMDLDLYQRGAFSRPLHHAELAPVVAILKRLPGDELDAIGGITILDEAAKSSTLGMHDAFGNIVLFRHYGARDLQQGIHIQGLPFLEELVTHEVGHANQQDLSRGEFALFVGCAGFQRVGLYSPEYKLAAAPSRKMTSNYHPTIYEEFAEHWTHYKKNGDALRALAVAALHEGDPFLALEYLFFKHVVRETLGKEFHLGGERATAIAPEHQITLAGVRRVVDALQRTEVMTESLHAHVRRCLEAIAHAAGDR